jgi:hypothetical protein
MLKELFKFIKFPLMTVDFLVAAVVPFILKHTPDYLQLVLDSINYQHLATVFLQSAALASERDVMKTNLLLMQSTMCKDKLIDYSAFEPRTQSEYLLVHLTILIC